MGEFTMGSLSWTGMYQGLVQRDHLGMTPRAMLQSGAGGLSWMVLVVALVIAGAAAGFAKVAGAPVWLVVVAPVVGVAVLPVAAAVRAQMEQQQKSRTEVRRLTAGGAVAPQGLVRDQSARDLQVHQAVSDDVPYVEQRR